MVVKNEEKVIERCLNTVKDIIDYYVIVDTGSSDSTIEKIKSSLKNIPGEIHNSKWVNFGFNRSEALKLAKDKTDYALLLDADMTVDLHNFNKEDLKYDGYYLRYNGDCNYAQMLLINNRLSWSYAGVTHEYLFGSFDTTGELNSIKINHYKDGGSKSDKFERDIILLEQGIIDEPNNSRYYFYLANSYRDNNNYEKAVEYYLRRAKMGGWEEEVYYSIYQLGYCNEKLGKLKEAKYYYLQAWEYRPSRGESLYNLSVLCRNNKEYQQAYMFAKKGLEISYPKDLLFIDRRVYDYLLLWEKSISAYWLGKYSEAIEDCKKIENLSGIPKEIKIQNKLNMDCSIKKLLYQNKKFDKVKALETLKKLNELGLTYFLMAGTLLGVIRNGDFLDHDNDIDIGIIGDNDAEEIKNRLINYGFSFYAEFGIKGKSLEYRFFNGGIQLDIFFYYEDGDQIYFAASSNNGEYYKYIFDKFNIVTTNLKNIRVNVPSNAEKYIETQYGLDWMIENKNYNYIKDAKNIRNLNKE